MIEKSRKREFSARLERLSDHDLLLRFAQDRDEGAFHVLVQRHGDLVFRACRAVLRHHHDAEDAFQATFLVLAKKAGKVRWQTSIANWLYTTAYRVSLKASVRIQKERAQHMGDEPGISPVLERLAAYDAERVLHEELNQLHERHRMPLVMCYLQGLTYAEAAKALGLTLTTLNGRLQRARHKLRVRLLQRGIGLALPTAAATGAMSAQAAGAATSFGTSVPSQQLITSTVRAATDFATGSLSELIRPEAFTLAKGEMAMISTTVFAKPVCVGAAALTLLTLSCLLLSTHASAQTRHKVLVLDAQVAPQRLEAQHASLAIAEIADSGDRQLQSEVYAIAGGSMRLVGSRKTNVISIFSNHTGRWHKQPYEPLPGEDVQPVISQEIVVFQAGKRVYGFSALKGVWDSFEIPDKSEDTPRIRPRVYDERAEVELDDAWYAFSAVAPEPKWVRADLDRMD